MKNLPDGERRRIRVKSPATPLPLLFFKPFRRAQDRRGRNRGFPRARVALSALAGVLRGPLRSRVLRPPPRRRVDPPPPPPPGAAVMVRGVGLSEEGTRFPGWMEGRSGAVVVLATGIDPSPLVLSPPALLFSPVRYCCASVPPLLPPTPPRSPTLVRTAALASPSARPLIL